MATKETRLLRGRRRGWMLVARTVRELRETRLTSGLSLASVAHELGIDPATLWRLESDRRDASVVRLCEIASLLGLELSLGSHPIGDPLRDKGQIAVGMRFEKLLSPRWRVTDETLLPGTGELRAWDKLLRLVGDSRPYRVGVDIETRVRDIQALVRRTRGRERDGMVEAILIVLADSGTNRRLVHALRAALGESYATPARRLIGALRAGVRLPGSGVILV